MFGWLRPKEKLDSSDVQAGLRLLLFDGTCSQAMGALTGGAFLIAFALLLGASNAVIGLVAAVGPLSQVLQIPAVFLVDRTGLRKAMVVISSLFSRFSWLIVASLPWLVPAEQRVSVLLACLFLYFGLGTISGCAFNSWMRDLVPEEIMGRYFGKRLAVATATGAGLSLLAGIGLELGKRVVPNQLALFSILFVVGAGAGLLGVYFLARVPEPKMVLPPARGMASALAEPFKEFNFRRLLFFLGSWSFAVNLAAPFFVVYMLTRLGMSMAVVLGLSVVSQIVNVLFLRIWGRLADRLSNKSVLTVSGPLFMVSIVLWPFLTLPEKHMLTVPLLIAIHVLAGMSTAGVALCASNIALKAAPKGKATAFLAANALVSGLAATAAPVIAGFGADWFAGQNLRLSIEWLSTITSEVRFSLPAIDLKGLDFLFMISFVFGLYAIHRLLAVREEGEVEEKVVVTHLYREVRKAVRHVSNIAGLRHLTYFPYERLRRESGQTSADQTDAP